MGANCTTVKTSQKTLTCDLTSQISEAVILEDPGGYTQAALLISVVSGTDSD